MSKIFKIVITGGPCAGKSSSLQIIKNYYEKFDIKVLTVSETATDLINKGIAPWTCETPLEFQKLRVKEQIRKENEIYEYAKKCNYDKVLIIFDRGLLDTIAYTGKEKFNEIIKELNLNIINARDEYDAVFHLTSVSKGEEDSYTLENNQARTESIDEAKILDDKIISSWVGHPHFRIIENHCFFEDKIKSLIKEINLVIDNSNQLEIERKYLIKLNDKEFLNNNSYCEKVNITQTYLKITDHEEIRVRKRGIDNNYLYYYTVKKNINGLKRLEIENRISEIEYLKLLENVSEKIQINKERYCLVFNNQYFEIDVYPFLNNQAIMEIEISDEDKEIYLPDFIEVIKEVTEDKEFKNNFLAKKYGVKI